MKQASKKEDTKQRILDEALRLFSQSGYDAVSVERKLYPTLWTSGLIVCLFSLVVCVLIIILLIAIMAAAFNGNWI